MNPCPDCEGTGTINDKWAVDSDGNLYSEDVRCNLCFGTGLVSEDVVESWKDLEVA